MKIGAVAILAPALVVLNARPSPYHVDHDYTIAAKSAADVASIEDTHFTNLTKRTPYPPISQVAWELAVNEGCNLLRAIDSRDELAVTFQGRVGSIQSEFLNYPSRCMLGARLQESVRSANSAQRISKIGATGCLEPILLLFNGLVGRMSTMRMRL